MGTFSGKDSVATDTIRLDFPVPWSPITATRTLVRPPKLTPPPDPAAGTPDMIDANKDLNPLTDQKRQKKKKKMEKRETEKREREREE